MDWTCPAAALSESSQAWRLRVRDFARQAVAPLAAEMDSCGRFDPGLIKELFAAGLMGVEVPESYGGGGRDLLATVLTIEELARADPAVAVLADVQNALVVSALLRHGSGNQKRRFLPRLATGLIGGYALSEKDAGSDAFALSTTAVPDGTGYRLSGRKRWTTNAAEAGLFVIFARVPRADGTAPGLAAFLVDAEAGGLRVADRVPKLGIRASSTCDVELDGVRAETEDMLGGVHDGRVLAMETLNIGKLGIAAQLTGLAQGALEAALGYAQHREQFGEAIIGFQGVQFPLARIAAELTAARVLLYQTAARFETMPAADRLSAAAMAKYLASEVAERAASQAVETLGGNGYSALFPAEKFYRDAKVGKIYEGTSNMQLKTIITGLLSATGSASVPGEW